MKTLPLIMLLALAGCASKHKVNLHPDDLPPCVEKQTAEFVVFFEAQYDGTRLSQYSRQYDCKQNGKWKLTSSYDSGAASPVPLPSPAPIPLPVPCAVNQTVNFVVSHPPDPNSGTMVPIYAEHYVCDGAGNWQLASTYPPSPTPTPEASVDEP